MTGPDSTEPAIPDPAEFPSSWAWNNVPDDAAFPSAYSYDVLRDTIIQAFNPADDDVAEEALMTDALDSVWRFVVAQPCTCPPGAAEFEVDSCSRCQVLGRAADVKVER